MKKYGTAFFCGVIIVIVAYAFAEHHSFIAVVQDYISGAYRFSQVAYVLLLISVSTYLPLNALPIIPFGAGIFGPFQGAILSAFGWSVGSTIAFLISRTYGRSYIEKYVSLSKLDRVAELLPEQNRFFALLIFRLVLPSDLASYALGLTKSLRFRDYFASTVISYTLYSFLLSYLGHALLRGHHLVAFKIALALLAIFSIGWYLLNRLRN